MVEAAEQKRRSLVQTDPPRSPRETLPTMYDLPSEYPEEPGLPDEYHYLQPQLLSATLKLTQYSTDEVFSVGDMNLYYDVKHPLWHKRPDWFAVVGVPRLYDGQDLRLSYVVWQEGVNPFVVVELQSPGTEKEDLGETSMAQPNQPTLQREGPPSKWAVYEQILRIPYYFLFDRYTNQFRAFHLVGGQYQAMTLANQRASIPELGLSLGVWQGTYRGIVRPWLRWFTASGEMILTAEEKTAQAEERAERLAERLRELGVDPDEI